MIEFFHRARHWMLFIPLLFPTLLQIYLQSAYFQAISRFQVEMQTNPGNVDAVIPDLHAYAGQFNIYLLVMAVSFAVMLVWYFAVGGGLQHYLPEGTGLKPQRMRLALLALGILMLVFLGTLHQVYHWAADTFSGFDLEGQEEPPGFDGENFLTTFMTWFGATMLFFLLYALAYIYCAYYAGKTLKSIELGRPARGSEVAGYAVLSAFLVIGVWILQPKINRLVETGTMANPGDNSVW
ncbi:hypothetical protein QWY85_16210 [Neolewinella lacunae]|uniref:Uncharacterized protein n=1 Tax=Neolewinella lacunae TaxID=1517758 RepID=A0A923PKT0_9BACT|nr:hypothetical protein [Neolewinella lacunae]MBC6993511.1 hypothetical protein [Neolewinella lacunae]MDN3636213.1 hypothetical protein [Neolewinella lacunae]